MKKVFVYLMAMVVGFSTVAGAQEQQSTGEKLKTGAKKTGKAVKKGAKQVGNKTAELASKGAAQVKDKVYKGKVAPNGKAVYISDEGKYYWIDAKGKRQWVTEAELKDAVD
ncbi:MAG: hypothetical protein JWQ96_2967 [Segetibacter sp.]|nr:hypothetical protein [Segetibacter sp.]